MSLFLFFLGLICAEEEVDVTYSFDRICDDYKVGLVSLDPLTRIRSAWLSPEYSVKADTITVSGTLPGYTSFTLGPTPIWEPQTGIYNLKIPATFLEGAQLTNVATSITPLLQLNPRTFAPGLSGYVSIITPSTISTDSLRGKTSLYVSIPIGKVISLSADGEAIAYPARGLTGLNLPHRGIASYFGSVTGTLVPSENMKVNIRVLRNQRQEDIFSPYWIFNPASAPSVYQRINMLVFDYRYRTDRLILNLALSAYNSLFEQTARETGDLNLFTPFLRQDTIQGIASMNTDNPFGVDGIFYSSGANPDYTVRISTADRAYLGFLLSAGIMHQITGTFEYTGYNLITTFENLTESGWQLNDIQHTPRLGQFYVGDRIHLEEVYDIDFTDSLWVEPGLGLTYFEQEEPNLIEEDNPVSFLSFSPRLEVSATSKDLCLNAGTDIGAETPPYEYFYDSRNNVPLPDTLIIVADEFARTMRAWKTWATIYKDWDKGLSTGVTLNSALSYKLPSAGLNPAQDTLDTIPSVGVFSQGKGWSISAAPWVEYSTPWFDIAAYYRFQKSEATTEGPLYDYIRLSEEDSTVSGMTPVVYNSKHKIVLLSRFRTPDGLRFWARQFFIEPRIALASGFSQEQGENAPPWWAWCEVSAGKLLTFPWLQVELSVDLLNPFNWSEPVIGELPDASYPVETDYPDRTYLGDAGYHPGRDINHDGVITAAEEVQSFTRAQNYFDAATPNPLPARSLELKLSVRF